MPYSWNASNALIPLFMSNVLKASRVRWMADALMIFAGVALMAVSAQVRIPLPFTPVPLTGQSFAVLLIGASYGSFRGALTAALYLAFGLAGLPLFDNGAAGIVHLFGPTGGYLVGFVFAAGAMGLLAERGLDRHFQSAWPLFILGHTIIFAFGVTWLSRFIGWELALASGYFPFLIGEVVKTSAAAALLPKAHRWLGNKEA